MRRAWGLTILLALAPQAWAQAPLDAGERQGRALFIQHCAVCHLKPALTAGLYGPALSKDSLNGNAEVMRIFIREGSPRMPGFKYEFTPAEVNTIIRYLQTVPAQAQPAPTPASARAGQAD
jgi:mono/diheme cytochrome c family protein